MSFYLRLFNVLLLAVITTIGATLSSELRGAPGNAGHHLTLRLNGEVEVTGPDGARAVFAPVFNVLLTGNNPNLETRWGRYKDGGLKSGDTGSTYHVLTWGKPADAVVTNEHVADGYDPDSDRFYGADRSPNLFAAGKLLTLRATGAREESGRIIWTFPPTDGVTLKAELVVPDDGSQPRLNLQAEVARPGWYSFGYVGAPACDPAAIDELWQPLVYTERRFPEDSFLEAAARCPLPTTLVRHGGTTVGVMADPAELPFQPMPTFAASRFGVALRNRAGQAQPMLFAPILGGAGSKLKAGDRFEFSHRLVVVRKNIDQTQELLARTLFGFADVRHNILGSLNATFDRMLEFGLSDHAKFNTDLRGFAYDTDVPGSVKNVSALHPLSLAMVTDNREIFNRLALPLAEFFVSRERFLFTTDPTVKGQSASARLGGLGAPLSEFSTLYQMSGNRTPFFLSSAESLFGKTRVLNLVAPLRGDFWANSLALYRATGDRKWLERAKRDADDYLKQRIDTVQTNFEDPDSRGLFFWTSFSPQWKELFELYEETGERRYLEAARKGARNYTRYVWFSPRIPQGDVTVNTGGFAPNYRSGPKFPKVPLAEESVPAWQVSEIGLTPESSGTSRGHRGILLACYAPWMLRIAALTNDTFLHDVARSAVIGRYTSFPGYHLNTARTTAYQKPDFAERPKDELNAMTSIHYNHIWPAIALVFDYLVSDVVAKSQGKVSFPSHYAEGYGYLQQKIYGDRPGRVYDTNDLYLWMPPGVVTVESPELNYVVARGENRLAIAFTNQSQAAVRSRVRINPELVGLPAIGETAKVTLWIDGKKQRARTLDADGSMEIEATPAGITAIVVQGVSPQVRFQAQVLSKDARPLPAGSVCELGFRGARAVAMRFGSGDLTSVYAYLPDFEREIVRSTLFHRQGNGAFATLEDTAYPYDYTVPVNSTAPVEFYVEVQLKDGRTEKSPVGKVMLE
ncbi:MAG: hypothetical protein PSV13_05365 [Lacunisphaera sp.]|nr:hypothetical protein [Lacunisphaera sp.]